MPHGGVHCLWFALVCFSIGSHPPPPLLSSTTSPRMPPGAHAPPAAPEFRRLHILEDASTAPLPFLGALQIVGCPDDVTKVCHTCPCPCACPGTGSASRGHPQGPGRVPQPPPPPLMPLPLIPGLRLTPPPPPPHPPPRDRRRGAWRSVRSPAPRPSTGLARLRVLLGLSTAAAPGVHRCVFGIGGGSPPPPPPALT